RHRRCQHLCAVRPGAVVGWRQRLASLSTDAQRRRRSAAHVATTAEKTRLRPLDWPLPRRHSMQDDDFSLFQSAVRGVRPISHDRADTGKPKADRQRLNTLRQAATVRTDAVQVDGLSDQFVIDVGAEDELYWARDGVQDGQMRKLKAGQIAFEGSLDLHGMSVEKARETLWAFFAEAARMEVRCVRVTHGKAARID